MSHSSAETFPRSLIVSVHQIDRSLPSYIAHLIQVQQHSSPPLFEQIAFVGHVGNARGLEFPANFLLFEQFNIAKALNEALEALTAPIICFTEASMLPDARWVEQMTAPFASADVVGVKGTYRSDRPELAACFLNVEYQNRHRRLASPTRVDLIELYSAAYRRQTLLSNGGFDDQLAALHDRELSYRLIARGYKLAFAAEAAVLQNQRVTWWRYFQQKRAAGFWNAQIVRRFPNRFVSDSNTPITVKLQMVLVALMGLWGVAALGLDTLRALAISTFLITTLLFVLTTLPLSASIGRNEPRRWATMAISPFAQLLRAVALILGYSWGLIRPIANNPRQHTTISGINYVGKRLVDIVGGLVGSFVLLLILPLTAWLIKRDSAGPIFFTQERVGQDGQPFTCYKFRTMSVDAEAKLSDLIDIDKLEQPAFKLVNDPRITPVGRILRRWSIDEIPQFWNVLKGDMSLVGPRPEETRIVARYNDWQRRRLAVKPGLSGPMQIQGRGDLPLNERVRLEIEYIESYTLWSDVQILLRTLPAVWSGSGAH